MSNLVQRICSNAVLFALLMSVSLTLHANTTEVSIDNASVSNHFIACEFPDQAPPDIDLDSHVNAFAIRLFQPLPNVVSSFYQSTNLNRPFSTAYQRGPPSYLI
ncbi:MULTISPECIES: hypothetical protein [Pseudoalteromonas]|uniref:Uncharacterized protein n=1 Tax=Pseudoalteromonas undina TaxID=43660 RepID=A0ACC6R8E0_9GAMM|nr:MULTISPECIES: hypothetical protein [unclassified Pseudoalteromonas]KPZ54943.1 hypothetical protein AN393_02008 [Pseudoalteromonas sp. P1-25]KPZ56444.1 hypothetical protein AN391_02223 [Pseudoalteromonas sp. P1-13-1a]KPZ61245.1 hypothetical protein AN389_01941 [Pseudoalteromonas sp. P1-7a]